MEDEKVTNRNHLDKLKTYAQIKQILWNCVTDSKYFDMPKNEQRINLGLVEGLMNEIEQKIDVSQFMDHYQNSLTFKSLTTSSSFKHHVDYNSQSIN